LLTVNSPSSSTELDAKLVPPSTIAPTHTRAVGASPVVASVTVPDTLPPGSSATFSTFQPAAAVIGVACSPAWAPPEYSAASPASGSGSNEAM
jgi:hypothetical protein